MHDTPERALGVPVYRAAVRPNDSRPLTDIRATNDDGLHTLVVVFEEMGDVVMGGDGMGMNLGILIALPLLSFVPNLDRPRFLHRKILERKVCRGHLRCDIADCTIHGRPGGGGRSVCEMNFQPPGHRPLGKTAMIVHQRVDTAHGAYAGRAAQMPQEMRTTYHEKLSDLSNRLGEMCGIAGSAMDHATGALLDADLAASEQVISGHDRMVSMSAEAEKQAISLLALQQPVAGELRDILTSLQIVADIERMDALAVHVAKIARRRHPQHAVPDEVSGCFSEMGEVAVDLANIAHEVLRTRDPHKAAGIRERDDAIDNLHRRLLTVLMDDRAWMHGIPAAVDVALLGRFYERFADHAVEIGRRVVFQVTGILPPEQEVGTY